MFTAKHARQIRSRILELELKDIENTIRTSAERGETEILFNLNYTSNIEALQKLLRECGYNVKHERGHDEIADWNHLKISWKYENNQ